MSGATATGKSSLAEYLSTQHVHHNLNNYEIVVADSVQAMQFLNIGSNKPTNEERAAIPHHMVDIHAPGVLYSAGQYCQEATRAIVDIMQRGKVPLVVGGNTMVRACVLAFLVVIAIMVVYLLRVCVSFYLVVHPESMIYLTASNALYAGSMEFEYCFCSGLIG